MSIVAALVFAASASTTAPAVLAELPVATARVGVRILRPVLVRQDSGLQRPEQMPAYQVTRSDGAVLYEFQ